uniref:Uncharacterized protein n=1 Tax=Megaviridae environmental sample TaxID=1737588 RepID=A0A5J6VNA2_9VIRU|nr:MAG: hypothetical protein [Megaviridae environmental sample]
MSFDLNIENYNKEDLENLLSLENPYKREDVISKCNILKSNLQQTNDNPEVDSKIQSFLNLANEKLCSFLYDNNQSLSVVTYADDPERMKGTINPLYKRKVNKLLTIDTKFRTHFNELSTNFKFDLPMRFKNIYEIGLQSIEFSSSLKDVFQSSKIYPNINNYYYSLSTANLTTYNTAIDGLKTLFDTKISELINENSCLDITDEVICDLKRTNTDLKTKIEQVKTAAKFEKIYVNPEDPSQTINNCDEPNTDKTYLFNIANGDVNITGTDNINYFNISNTNKITTFNDISTDVSIISFGYDSYLDYDDTHRELIECLFKNEYISDHTPLQLKLGWLLGYRKKMYSITDVSSPKSEAMFTGNSNNYLYLSVDDFNNNVSDGYFSAFNSSILNKNILSRIALSSIGNDLITSFTRIPRSYFGPVDLEKLHIQLLDEYGKPVYLQNMDYSFALNLTEIYN